MSLGKTILACSLFIVFCGCSSSSDSSGDSSFSYGVEPLEVISTENLSLTDIVSKITAMTRTEDVTELTNKVTKKVFSLGLSSVISDVVKYHSTGVGGDSLYLSGKIYIPKQSSPIRGIVIDNHVTITSNAEAPSQSFQLDVIASLLGYVVVMSDYIGFGQTKNLPQTYLSADLTAQSSVDLALCTYQYLKQKRYKMQYNTNKVYIGGYSQGAAVSLAVQKLIESRYSDKFEILKTFAGAGPYDIVATYKDMIETDKTNISAVPALVLMGMDYSESLHLDYNKYFKGKLLSNYNDWINSKNYTTNQINDLLGTVKASDMLTDDARNADSDLMKPLMAAFKKNSLVEWVPKAPIYMYHSTTDNVVPVINSENAYNYFKSHSSAKIETDFGDYGSHNSALVNYVIHVGNSIY